VRWASIIIAVICVVRVHAGVDTLRSETTPHTVDVIEAAVRELTDTVIVRAGVTAGESASLFVHEHPDASWIRTIVARRMEERGVPVTLAEAPLQADLELTVMDVSTRYAPVTHRDSLERQVVVKLGTTYKRRAIRLESRTDVRNISRLDAYATQSSQHSATHTTLPDAPSSIWEDALEPLIYIAAAVVTIVLFFTVRTQ
jgi:hypothetical protein